MLGQLRTLTKKFCLKSLAENQPLSFNVLEDKVEGYLSGTIKM